MSEEGLKQFKSLKLSNQASSNGSIGIVADLKYELEWQKDFFNLAFTYEADNFYESLSISDHHFNTSNKILFISQSDGYKNLELSLNTDSSLDYRGVVIDSIEILTPSVNNCEYGDINHNGMIDINDIVMIINTILSF